ncbi:MAG: FG-GAP-like repeat-containing protein [Patescibacteria group bacterium]
MQPSTFLTNVNLRERTATRIHSAVGIAIVTIFAGSMAAAIFLMSSETPAGPAAEASVGTAAIDATNSVTVRWTSPGDDGSTGQAASYDLRYGTAAMTDANWGFATAAQGEPAPKPAGQAEAFLVTNLQPNTTYFFGLKTADESGNISALSNIASKKTAPLSLPGCVEDWRCDAWQACTSGTQTRTCADRTACGTTSNKPTATQACQAGAPLSTADTVAPNTVITAAPVGTLTEPRYRFTWRGLDDVTDVTKLEFSYKLDNRAWSGWNTRTEVIIRRLHNGKHTFSVRSRDAAKNIDPSPATATFNVRLGTIIGAGVERGADSQVVLLNTAGKALKKFRAFEAGFRGGVRVQVADLGDDGFGEVVVASGPGRVSELRLFRTDGSRITSFQPYGNAYRDGLFVTVADVDGNGPMEIITAKQKGTPNVRVFGYKGGRFTQVYKEFNGNVASFRNGISLAAGDLNGDGKDEIVTAPAGSGANTLRVFQLQGKLMKQIATRTNALLGTGLNVATADLANDGVAEIVVAPRSNGAPTLRTYSLRGTTLAQYRKDVLAYRTVERSGVRLSAVDLNTDGKDDVITSYGAPVQPRLTVFNGATFAKFKVLNLFSTKDRLVLTHDSGT